MSSLKIEAARRQLGTSLALYLEDHDPVSVHCLALGGCELIEHYAKKAGGEPFVAHIMATWSNLNIEELRRLQRRYWTAFKHATHRGGKERDDDETLSNFSDENNDAALWIGWHDSGQAVRMMPIEAQAHQAWYIALHPEKLNPKHPFDEFAALFPNLKEQPRSEEKRRLREAIEDSRANKELMSHPQTETRGLCLGWSMAKSSLDQ